MTPTHIEHIGIAVKSLDEAIYCGYYRTCGNFSALVLHRNGRNAYRCFFIRLVYVYHVFVDIGSGHEEGKKFFRQEPFPQMLIFNENYQKYVLLFLIFARSMSNFGDILTGNSDHTLRCLDCGGYRFLRSSGSHYFQKQTYGVG